MGKKLNKPKDGAGSTKLPNFITHRIIRPNTKDVTDLPGVPTSEPLPKINWAERLEQCEAKVKALEEDLASEVKWHKFELSGREELISDMEAQIKKLETQTGMLELEVSTGPVCNPPWGIAFRHALVGKTVAFLDDHGGLFDLGFTDGSCLHVFLKKIGE